MIIRQAFRMSWLSCYSSTSLKFFAPALGLLLMTACSNERTQLQQVLDRQQLRVLTRISPVSYFPGGDSSHAFEQELVTQFAKYLGVEAKFILAHTADIYPRLLQGEADLAVGGVRRKNTKELRFGPAYQTVTPVFVGNRNKQQYQSLGELLNQNRFTVPSGADRFLTDLFVPEKFAGDTLSWDPRHDSEELIKNIARGTLGFTISTSNEFDRMRNYYPDLMNVFKSEVPMLELAWAFKNIDDNSLFNRSERFFQKLNSEHGLERMIDRYYGHTKGFNYWNNVAFIERIEERLPAFERLFKQAAEKHTIDWRLLAAISYQESHWESDASSYTGVRGLMMLTSDTAKEMGVEDRTDPAQSIEGGARYFIKIKNKLADRIVEPDRTWFALAAYNVGYGHLEDARVLAESAGKNPDQWYQVEPFLPKLSQKEWYEKTRYGAARGEEPVQFVRNIRRFYDILIWFDNQSEDLRQVKRRLDKMSIDLPTL